ncbi:unnamed protein product [Nesidiocoris tenuis]|uniref:Uncharacterized protein n=1 Tax=Nesidiocoris tenuis TaxID=355587 RepID=A0A6H5FWN1_9HEMI|nr:unnamed protein product [Nesidiocoris tenuis]
MPDPGFWPTRGRRSGGGAPPHPGRPFDAPVLFLAPALPSIVHERKESHSIYPTIMVGSQVVRPDMGRVFEIGRVADHCTVYPSPTRLPPSLHLGLVVETGEELSPNVASAGHLQKKN